MPVRPTYPGVYIEEIPSGVRTIVGVSTSVAAFIDYFRYGPMNKAVQILNMGDFEREFGGLDSNSEASYAIQQFFLNGGSEAWVVRTASGTPEKPLAKSKVEILNAIDGAVALTVEAISEGDWGNNLRIKIDHNTTAPKLFNMNISEFKNIQGTLRLSRSEDFLNLSMDSTNPHHVMKVVNDENSGSRMIRVTSTGNVLPLQNGTVSGDLPESIRLTATKPTVSVTIGTEGTGEAALDIDNTNPSDLTLQNVRSLLEKAIRSSKPDKPAFAAATVELSQNRLRVLAGPASESSTITFGKYINPTLKELKLDLPDSVKGVISEDLSAFSGLTATNPSLSVSIGGIIRTINLTNPTSSDKLGEIRTQLETEISQADPENLAFKNARVSVYESDTGKHLIILSGLPDSDISFAATNGNTQTLNQLGLGASSKVNGIISGDLTKKFPDLTASSISIDLKIGSEGPHTATFPKKPTNFSEARENLEKAIKGANSSPAFTGARVALYNKDSEWRLIILINSPASNISFKPTADTETLNNLGLDLPDSVKGVISGDLSAFSGLTATNPSLSVSIGGIIRTINLTNPTSSDKLGEIRIQLETEISQADPENLAFKNARVSVYESDTGKHLIILSGLPDSDISFAATNGDIKTLNELGLDKANKVNSAVSKGLTTLPSLTTTSSVSVTIGSEGPHTATFSEVPGDFPGVRKNLEKAINDAHNSPAFKGVKVALYEKDSEPRLIVTVEDVGNAVVFTATQPDADTVTKLKLTPDQGAQPNVQEYKLGNNMAIPHTAQGAGVEGSNGIPPKGDDLIGVGSNPDDKKGLYALDDVDLFNILCIPRISIVSGDNALSPGEVKTVMARAIDLCERRRAFFVIDTPTNINDVQKIKEWADETGIRHKNAALYFPRIKIADPLNEFRLRSFGASGTIAGLYARTDSNRGVWKAPAGTEATLVNAHALDYKLTDGQNGTLNPLAINCLRNFPIYGNICWGARTLDGADQKASEWKYIPVRRVTLFIEESLFRGTQWVVFEPNDEPLWAQIRLNIGAFMHSLFRQGAFQGQTPKEAYFVKCDKETTNQTDINSGIVNIVVGFAPLKPAEFVIIQIQQMAGQIQV